jgi:hypothetical protein
MGRFRMSLAAAVTTGLVIVAVAALDAVGADKTSACGDGDIVERVANCMRDRGVAIPALTGARLEQWLKSHRLPEATARACKMAIGGVTTRRAPADGVEKILACLRAHDLNPPSAPDALKRWILDQHDPAVTEALQECGMAKEPPSSDCGGEEPGKAGGT